MFEKIIKDNLKKTYIIFFSIAFIILSYNFYQEYAKFDIIDYSKYKSQINNIKLQNEKLKKELLKKQKIFLSLSSKLIDKPKLKKDITLLCNNLVKTEYLTKANVLKIEVPYKYLNVAKISIVVGNRVDMLILKRVLNKLYYVKSFYNTPTNNNLIIEIYKEL